MTSWKEDLLRIYVKRGGILKGHFKLTGGGTSDTYIDGRMVTTYYESLEVIADELANRIKPLLEASPGINIIAPVLSGIPIGAVLSTKLKVPYVIDRGVAKGHGTGKRFEGSFTQNPECIIVDDLITRGSTLVELINTLRGMDKVVKEAFIVVDREEGGQQVLADLDVKLTSLLTKRELLDAFDRFPK